MTLTLQESIDGLLNAESKLSSKEAINNPVYISQHMYRLGQYASALEKHLGDAQEAYEIKWAEMYQQYAAPGIDDDGKVVRGLSATAAKTQADVDCAADKGNIKKLTRYVSSSWRIYTGAMARVNHLTAEANSMRGQT